MPVKRSPAVAGKRTTDVNVSNKSGYRRDMGRAPGAGDTKGRSIGRSSSRVVGGVQGGGSSKPGTDARHSGTHGGKFTSGNTRGGPTSLGASKLRPGAGGGPEQHGMSQAFSTGQRRADAAQPAYDGKWPTIRGDKSHTGRGRG